MRYVKVKFEKLNLNFFSFKTKMTGLSKKNYFKNLKKSVKEGKQSF